MGLLMPSIPQGVSVHTWMATASHGTSIGQKAAVQAAKVLALTGRDILTDTEFLNAVTADFERRTTDFTYVSPIPDFVKEPVGLPADMRSFEDPAKIKDTFFQAPGDHEFHDHDHDHLGG